MLTTGKLVNRIRRELRYYRAVLRDPRTSRAARWLIGAGVGYLLLPFDIVPDFIPVIGQLDDVIVVSILVGLGLLFVPASVKRDVRLRTRPVRSRYACAHSPVLCETEALPSCFGVRVNVIESRSTTDDEEILQALLKLVFEERVVVIDRAIGRRVFEPISRASESFPPAACARTRIAEHSTESIDLRDVEVESRDTVAHFIDMLAAYDALPFVYKEKIHRLKICRDSRAESAMHHDVSKGDQSLALTFHPLAPKHPVTRRRLLSPDFEMCGIVGMPDEEGSRLLEELKNHSHQSRFQYEHRYDANEIVVWDSTTTLDWMSYEAIASPSRTVRPFGSSEPDRRFHSSYRVLLRSSVSASPSAATTPAHGLDFEASASV